MAYLTTIERLAIARTKVAQVREDVVDVLTVRFGSVPDEVAERLNEIDDLEKLKQLLRQAVLVDVDSWCRLLV